jgi:hypothetical protein
MSRLTDLQSRAARCNLHIRTYSPGDGVTRYRFFTDPANSYFGPSIGIGTVLGFKAAETFVNGYCAAWWANTSQPAGYHPPPELTLDLHGHCPRCAEQLAVEGYPVALCPTCDGAGEVAFPSPCYYASGWEYIDVDCPSCSGDCIDPDTGWDSMSAAWCEYLTGSAWCDYLTSTEETSNA